MENPLILTVLLNESAQHKFDILRDLHFPAEINYLKAHLTLFHQLKASDSLNQDLENLCLTHKSFKMDVTAVVSIGNGVAYKIESPELSQLHLQLQKVYHKTLIAQDKQKLWPHITVQNKVGAVKAKALKEVLEKEFEPYTIQAEGVILWEYCNGPWKHIKTFYFSS